MRKGQYGASAVFDEVEFKLDESKVRLILNQLNLLMNSIRRKVI